MPVFGQRGTGPGRLEAAGLCQSTDSGADAFPQGAKAPPAKPALKNRQSIKITKAVRPAFILDPNVNRIEARRGKVVDVEFGTTGEGAASNLEIQPVALTQDENGAIFANTKVPAPKVLEILTPLTVQLSPNEKFVVKGRLGVPDSQSTFHTFGVLVREAGQVKSQPNPEKADGPRIGIRFVTQYLLRCDVTVQGVRSENVEKPKIDSEELVEVDGIPVARVHVVTPPEGSIEFGLRTEIRKSEASESRPTFPLGMPVRTNLEEPEKYIGRILPGPQSAWSARSTCRSFRGSITWVHSPNDGMRRVSRVYDGSGVCRMFAGGELRQDVS